MSSVIVAELSQIRTSEDAQAVFGSLITRFNEASDRLTNRHDQLAEEITALQARLKAKDEELARAARLSTLGSMAAALAHEVRNPLGAMRLFVSLLREDLVAHPNALKLVEHVDQSISNLDRVVSNMLQFASDKPVHPAPVRPAHIVRELADTMRSEFSEIEIHIQGDTELTAMFDATALRQIVLNLWRNAAQAMKTQGRIETVIKQQNNRWILSIKDTGPGIPTHLLSTLFDPFVSGRNEGTGLGLAVVRRLAEQHQGIVVASNAATSSEGSGAKSSGAQFVLTFPIKMNSESEIIR